ncbi:aldo/keto reductase [Marinobacter sp. HL-58]|uniref:aldo/keto reductase n=1 Tax=Marinobacter sp. HL-58 TaxID=1479237 RepID=UPI0005685519|nr:aldo/keto reductase [Marinobacter sp. HL-58]KPP98988.1 MAG: putative oxidoreductase [Marinobacter sp. HL-58]
MQTTRPAGFTPDTPLILGMMRLHDHPELNKPAKLADWIAARLDEGLNVFDHADIYGNGDGERLFGEALRLHPPLARGVRVITKAGIVPAGLDKSPWQVKHYRAEASYLKGAIDRALTSLAVEQIDTFLIHRPDPLLQAEDIATVLENAVSAGKVRQIGVSNFLPEQWRWLARNTGLPLVCNQSQLSLAHNAPLFDGTLEAHLADGLRWLAWSPLGGGGLSQRIPEAILDKASDESGLDETGLAIAWLNQIPGTPVPVLGSMNPDRIHSALQGTRSRLSRPLWYRLLECVRNRPVA